MPADDAAAAAARRSSREQTAAEEPEGEPAPRSRGREAERGAEADGGDRAERRRGGRAARRRRPGVLDGPRGGGGEEQGEEAPAQLAGRAGHDRGRGARPCTRHPGVPRQAVPDPERVDGADARHRPARAGRPRELPLQRPRPRRHRGLQAAVGRRPTPAAWSAPSDQPCPRATPERSDTNFIKRVVACRAIA